jgi:hypothetical protein
MPDGELVYSSICFCRLCLYTYCSNPAPAKPLVEICNFFSKYLHLHSCFQVEVSATNWSLVQRSPTECGVSKKCDHEASKNEEA